VAANGRILKGGTDIERGHIARLTVRIIGIKLFSFPMSWWQPSLGYSAVRFKHLVHAL
jgi:hypothetical protein